MIKVLWLSLHKPEILARGYWDQALLEDTFKSSNLVFSHYDDPKKIDEGGAVVVVNGRTHAEDEDIEAINKIIKKLEWCLFIDTGDEESIFPWRDIKHKHMKVWVMLPRMNQHDDTSFKLPNGYRPETMDLLKQTGQQERVHDWFFAGQVNHERRSQCVDVLNQFKPLYPTSVIVETDGFGKEVMPYPQYIKTMAKSKIVLCPSGIESPDNFRLYEALQAGCLPVVDAFSTNFKTPGFWRYMFGDDIPFPIVNYWDELPDMLPGLLRDWPQNANRAFAWWLGLKRKLRYKLEDDIKELSK